MATINTGLIVPEIYAQLVREKIAGRMQVGQFLKKIDDLTGDVGETVTMPAWSYVGDASDWTVGTAMTTKKLHRPRKRQPLKQSPLRSRGYDYDNQVALGNAIDEATKQQAISIARKIDIDAINAAYGTPLNRHLQLRMLSHRLKSSVRLVFMAMREIRKISLVVPIVMHSAFADDLYGMISSLPERERP